MKSVCQKILFKNFGTGWLNCIMVSVYGMCIGSFMRFNSLECKDCSDVEKNALLCCLFANYSIYFLKATSSGNSKETQNIGFVGLTIRT